MANEFKIKNGLILGPSPSQPVISIQDTSASIVADASSILVTGKAIYDYVNSIPAGTLAGLIDVSIIDISSNQFLQYDFESSKWKNVSPLEASSYFWELSTALLKETSLGTGFNWNAGMLDVSASGGSGTGLTPIEISSNYNAFSNYLLLVNTSNNAIDITLPASPINGDIVQIIDVIKNASTNNINILRNGHLIDRTSSNFLIDIDGGSIKLVYHTLEDNFALLALETLKGYEEDVSSDATLDLSAVNQDYLPRVGSFINIGTSTNRIDAIYANDVYISHSSLWVNDKKVISDESDVITVSTDVNQDLMMKTTGSGDSKVESANGILLNVISGYISKDIELRTDSNAGSIILDANGTDGTLLGFANSNIELISQATLKLAGNSIEFDSSLDMTTRGNFTIDGCLSINGNIVQNGSSYITHSENVYTTKDFITMRDGALSALLDGSISGIRIVKPNNTNNVILGTDSDAIMRVGWEPGNLVALAGREDVPTNGYYAYWDDSSSIFKTKDLKGYIDASLVGFVTNASLGSDFVWTAGLLDVSIASSSVSSLDTLSDVSITSIADNQFIQYESSTSLWKNIDSIAIENVLPSFYYIDASYVRKSGDTMTGDLTVNTSVNILGRLFVNGNVGIDVSTLYVDSVNHRVGIGTKSPSFTLDVLGPDARFFLKSITATNPAIGIFQNSVNFLFGAEGGAAGQSFIGTSPYSGIFGTNGVRSIHFATSNVVQVTINSIGKVGIGFTNPSTNLDVSGNFHTTGAATIDASFNVKGSIYADSSIGFTGTFLADGSTVTVKNGLIIQVS